LGTPVTGPVYQESFSAQMSSALPPATTAETSNS